MLSEIKELEETFQVVNHFLGSKKIKDSYMKLGKRRKV
jgi:hypothetical protein